MVSSARVSSAIVSTAAIVSGAIVSTKVAWMTPSSSPKYKPERSMNRNSDSPQRMKTWCVESGG